MSEPRLFHLNWLVSAFMGMEVLRLGRMYIETLEQNTVVARGVERMGMRRQSLLRGHVTRDGQPLNVWVFSNTSQEYFDNLRGGRYQRWPRPELVAFEGPKVTT